MRFYIVSIVILQPHSFCDSLIFFIIIKLKHLVDNIKMILSFLFVFLIQIVPNFTQEGCDCDKISRVGIVANTNQNSQENQISANSIERPMSEEEVEDIQRGVNDMVCIPAGIYQVGTDNVILPVDREGPKRLVQLSSFYLDKYEVSNEEFSRFVAATNYKTTAEHFGESDVFQIFLNTTFKEKLKDNRFLTHPWWYKVKGTNWRHPYGPDSNISGTKKVIIKLRTCFECSNVNYWNEVPGFVCTLRGDVASSQGILNFNTTVKQLVLITI